MDDSLVEGVDVGGCAEPGPAPGLVAEYLGLAFFELLDAGMQPVVAFVGGEQVGLQRRQGDGRTGAAAGSGRASPQVTEQRLSGACRREPAVTSAAPGEELRQDRWREIARSDPSLEQPPAQVREQMRAAKCCLIFVLIRARPAHYRAAPLTQELRDLWLRCGG
jgi:hypothetical protein